ncbi:MFS transporter [Bacillus sp. JJ864]|uniref:MFS transporter n=1 Tax=Bacillus sp. JJ864 TaxID=3122975 RepID=UPI0030004611
MFETNNIEIWHIYISSIVISSLVAITMPAYESVIPLTVKEDELISANSLTELTLSVTTILGPAMAGGLISILGADTGILLNGIAFLIAGIIFSQVRLKEIPQSSSSNNVRELLRFFNDGLSYSVKHPLIKWGIFMSTSNNLILGAYAAMLIYYMRDDIGLNASFTGAVIAITGIASAITSAFIAPQLSKKVRKGITMICSLGLFGVVLVGLSNNLILLIIGQSLYVGSVTLFQINWYSLRQSITPKDYLGRVSGACRGIAYFGASIGSFLGGFLLKKISVANLFLINGSLVVLIAFIAMISKLRYTDTVEDFHTAETTEVHKL